MRILLILSFVAFACAVLPGPERKNYLESLKYVQDFYGNCMKMAKNASRHGRDEPTYFAMMLNALVKLSDNYVKNPSIYYEHFHATSISGMVDLVLNTEKFPEQLKNYYGVKIYKGHLSRIIELKNKYCKVTEMYKCNDNIHKFFMYTLQTLPDDEKTKYIIARDVLFSISDVGHFVWDISAGRNNLRAIAGKSHPELYFLDHPQEILSFVEILAKAIFNIKGQILQ